MMYSSIHLLEILINSLLYMQSMEKYWSLKRFNEPMGRIRGLLRQAELDKFPHGHETPFGAIAELPTILAWSASSNKHEERYLRLISVIAGYPEILTA